MHVGEVCSDLGGDYGVACDAKSVVVSRSYKVGPQSVKELRSQEKTVEEDRQMNVLTCLSNKRAAMDREVNVGGV